MLQNTYSHLETLQENTLNYNETILLGFFSIILQHNNFIPLACFFVFVLFLLYFYLFIFLEGVVKYTFNVCREKSQAIFV